jgi:hypothetical protein
MAGLDGPRRAAGHQPARFRGTGSPSPLSSRGIEVSISSPHLVEPRQRIADADCLSSLWAPSRRWQLVLGDSGLSAASEETLRALREGASSDDADDALACGSGSLLRRSRPRKSCPQGSSAIAGRRISGHLLPETPVDWPPRAKLMGRGQARRPAPSRQRKRLASPDPTVSGL